MIVGVNVPMCRRARYTVMPHTGSKSAESWRWTMTVSLFLAVPLVFCYFAFVTLETLECEVGYSI